MTRQQLRSSQLVMTFGPGAMVDLPKDSVIVGGLEGWRYLRDVIPTIAEPRLLMKVQQLLGVPDLTLRAPPAHWDGPAKKFTPEVEVWRFPEWFTVKTVSVEGGRRRRRLVPARDLSEAVFVDANGRSHSVVPVRFVRACENGHVDDIEWHVFLHGPKAECIQAMYLEERGTSGDIQDIIVGCGCGKQREMYQAALRDLGTLGHCSGARPWLGPYAKESCDKASRLLIRTASYAYFPQTLCAISIPPRGQALDEFVGSQITSLKIALEAPAVLTALRSVPPFSDTLREFDDAAVIASIRRILERGGSATVSIKEAEYEALADAKDELGSDKPHGDFFARALPLAAWERPWTKVLKRVVLVHRLREVVALVGFTRFESSSPDLNGELDIHVNRAPLSRDLSIVKWVPAVENRGEGIFLEFDSEAIHAWVARTPVRDRAGKLAAGYQSWCEEHQRGGGDFVGAPYVLLHSVAHLLMTSLSLECGYPASSLRERVFAMTALDGKSGRYGILIYTGSSDAEGTLGGLVEAGRSIARHLRSALDMAMLCSNDPVCAHHDPAEHGHSPLLGAACHGCLLVSETSCEMRNDYLDRALVVPTVEGHECEFFEGLG